MVFKVKKNKKNNLENNSSRPFWLRCCVQSDFKGLLRYSMKHLVLIKQETNDTGRNSNMGFIPHSTPSISYWEHELSSLLPATLGLVEEKTKKEI